MLKALLILLLFGFGLTILRAQTSDYPNLKSQAEKYYAEGSYARAYELYKKASAMKLSDQESRWVAFRLADSLWRAESATDSPDSTKLEEARKLLQKLVEGRENREEQDPIWA